MAEYCCVFRFPFHIWPAGEISRKDLYNFTSDIPNKCRQNTLNEFNGIYPLVSNRHSHKYRLFRLTQHIYGYFQTLHFLSKAIFISSSSTKS
jgi:hypothetical protein